MKQVLVLIGSASQSSSNHHLVQYMSERSKEIFTCTAFELGDLPPFDPQQSADAPPESVMRLRQLIAGSDGVLISTPEYIFSIPARLKNAFEWCVATTVFSDKPVALITASAHGAKGHAEVRMILETLMARIDTRTQLLIPGIRGKIDVDGKITDAVTRQEIDRLIQAFGEGL